MNYPFYLWLWRSAWVQPRRLVMILLFVAAGVTLLQVTLTLDRAFSINSQDDSKTDRRLMVLNALSTQMPLPEFYQQKIAALKEVKQVSWGTWVGAYYRHPGWFVPALAVEDKNYFVMIPSLKFPPGVLQRWQNDRQGALVDSRFADRYQLKAGDRLPLSSSLWQLAPNPVLDLYISGVVEETQRDNPPAVWLHYDYLESARQNGKGLVSFFMVMPGAGMADEKLSGNIDALFSAERVRGMTQTAPVRMHLKLFMSKLFDFSRVIFWVNIALCMLLGLLLASNFYVMSHRALSEYRTLGYLGFAKWRLMAGVAGQLAAITLSGALIGMLFSLLVIFILPALIPFALNGLVPHWQDYLYVLLVMLALALCCGLPSLMLIARQKEEVK